MENHVGAALKRNEIIATESMLDLQKGKFTHEVREAKV